MTPSPMVTSLLPRVSASAQGALPPAVVRVPATPSVDPAASLRRPVLPRASGQEKREMEKRCRQREASAWTETLVTSVCPLQAGNIHTAKTRSEGGEFPSLNLEREEKGM